MGNQGCLTRIPGPDPDEIGEIQAYEHSQGYEAYLRQDIPSCIQGLFGHFKDGDFFLKSEKSKATLGEHFKSIDVKMLETYIFEESPKESELTSVKVLDETTPLGMANNRNPYL